MKIKKYNVCFGKMDSEKTMKERKIKLRSENR